MKKILILIATICFTFLQAQDTAILKVIVQADDLTPLNGEQIIFEAQSGIYSATGTSAKDGTFKIPLLGAQVYNIKLKTVGQEEAFNTIEIPALAPNTVYGENVLTLTIYPPKNFTLDNVLFETGSSQLKTESKNELNELFEYLSLKEDIKIQIAGHTDNVGDADRNQKLSEERAQSVVNYLVNKGVTKERLSSIGLGDSQPIADNNTNEGRKKNRRTEVRIL